MRRSQLLITAIAVLFLSTIHFSAPPPAFAGISDKSVEPYAAIAAYKINEAYANDAAYVAARTAECASYGDGRCETLADGAVFFSTDLSVWRWYNGTVWGAVGAIGGASTLDAAYTAGQSIDVDLGTIAITDTTLAAVHTMTFVKGAGGTGNVIEIQNAGGGADIAGDFWSIPNTGIPAFNGMSFGDDEGLVLGTTAPITIEADTAAAPDGLLISAAASVPVYLGVDAAGLDLFLYTTAAGDLVQWDASGKRMQFTDSILDLDTGSSLEIGDTPFVFSYAAGVLSIDGVTGEEIAIGANGAGQDFRIYSDTGGHWVMWERTAMQLEFVDTTARFSDDYDLRFGAGAPATAGDIQLSYLSGTDIFQIDGAASIPVGFGDDTAGLDLQLYTDGGAALSGVTWDADSVRGGSFGVLEANDADVFFGDDDNALFGDGPAGGTTHDYYISGNGTRLLIDTIAGETDRAVHLGLTGLGLDLKLWGDSAGEFCGWDQSLDALTFDGSDIVMDITSEMYLGATALDASPPVDGFELDATATVLLIDSIANVENDAVRIGSGGIVDFQVSTVAGTALSDYSADLLTYNLMDVQVGATDQINFGDAVGGDLTMAFDGTADFNVLVPLAGDNWNFGNAAGTFTPDVLFHADTAADHMGWYGQLEHLAFVGSDQMLDIDSELYLGATVVTANPPVDGFVIDANAATLSFLQVAAGTGTLAIGVDNAGIDTTFYGEDTGHFMMWDQDTTAGAGVEAALIFEGGPDLGGDASFAITVGATAPEVPLDGFRITGAAGSMSINGVAATDNQPLNFGDVAETNLVLYGDGPGYGAIWDWDDSSLLLYDSSLLLFGIGGAGVGDVSMIGNGTNLVVEAVTVGAEVAFGTVSDLDVEFGTLIRFDDGLSRVVVADAASISFGGTGLPAAAADITYASDGAGGLDIDGVAGTENVAVGSTVEVDWVTHTDAGTASYGHAANTLTLAGMNLVMSADDSIILGDAAESSILYDGAGSDDLEIENVGNSISLSATTDTDVEITTAGGSAVFDDTDNTFTLTGITSSFAGGSFYPDDATLAFGNTAILPDVTFEWDTAAPEGMYVNPRADNSVVKWGADDQGFHQTFYMDAVNEFFEIDSANSNLNLEDVDLVFDPGSVLYLGTADPDTPANGIQLGGAAAALDIDGVAINSTVRVGNTRDTNTSIFVDSGSSSWDWSADTMTHGMSSGSMVVDFDESTFTLSDYGAQTVVYDADLDQMEFDDVDVSLTDDTEIRFGAGDGTPATPDASITWGSSDLFLQPKAPTANAAGITFQMGTDVAAEEVTLQVGNANAVVINGNNTAGTAIEYTGTAMPEDKFFLPAASFGAIDSITMETDAMAASRYAGWSLAIDESINTIWMPPRTLDSRAGQDIRLRVIWSTAEDTATDEFNLELFTHEYTLASSTTDGNVVVPVAVEMTDSDTDIVISSDDVLYGAPDDTTYYTIEDTSWTSETPMLIQIKRIAINAGTEATADIIIHGVEMTATRRYAD